MATEDIGLHLFITPAGLPEDAALRLAVPAVPSAQEPMLGAVRERLPEHTEVTLPPGGDDHSAERQLLDYWTDLPAPERDRVTCVVGRVAGALMRFDDRPATGFAMLGDPRLATGRHGNAQARALLAAAFPDSWTLALDAGPRVDADRWRFRLATAVSELWGIGLVERPMPAFEVFLTELGLEHPLPSPKLMFKVRPEPAPDGPVAEQDWLDAELHDHCFGLFEDGAVLDTGERSAARRIWEAARLGSVERRLRRIEGLVLPPAARGPRGGPDRTSAAALLINDPAEAAARLDPKMLRGKDGWLFLAHDAHDSHAQITGDRRLSPEELDGWESGMRARMDLTDSLGSELALMIGPAPQVVHADALPDGVKVSAARPWKQLSGRLGEMDPKPNVIYPLAPLVDARTFLSPFSRTDSHWNDLGAYLAYEAVIDGLAAGLPVRRVGREQVVFHETDYVGDLGSKMRPERSDVFLRARIEEPRARLVEDNRVRNHGRMAIFACDGAPEGTCVVFGDSWSYAMLLFLAESFRRLVFFHRVNVVDVEPLRSERPDLVLVVLTERFLTAVPGDGEAVPFERVAKKKIDRGNLVPAGLAPKTRPGFLHSVRLDRGLGDGPALRLPARARPQPTAEVS